MRYLPFIFVLSVFLSCSSTEAQTEASAATVPAETTAPASEIDPTDPPCETFSQADIAAAFGWSASMEGAPTTMRDGRLQSCLFMSKGNSGQASITISHSDARTIEAKYLESAYVRDLAREDDRLTSEEVKAGLGDQTIYTTGKRGLHHLYKLRWRQGNEIDYDVTLRSTKKRNKTAMLETLKGLAERI